MSGFDPVFDTQAAFRLLLDACARPGTVVDLAPLAARIAPPMAMNGAAAVVALTLLDAQTTFASWSSPAAVAPLGRTLRARTNARSRPPAEAAFHFVLGGEVDPAEAVEAASIGTLEDPHRGATVILEVDEIDGATTTEGTTRFLLEGPGIPTARGIHVTTLFDWWTPRARRVAEYPLGIDVLLVDRRDHLVALPRTTRVTIADAQAEAA